LCLSFSSNDYVGHAFGPHSHEAFDMLVRTDSMLADLFKWLDAEVGLPSCTIVLTSDHGISPIPGFLAKHSGSQNVGTLPDGFVRAAAERILSGASGVPAGNRRWVRYEGGGTIFLDRKTLAELGIGVEATAHLLADSLSRLPEIAAAFTRDQMVSLSPATRVQERLKNSYNPLRSGDVMFALQPFRLETNDRTGASHGAPYESDAHVPIIIVSKTLRPGFYYNEASPADIAPTLSALLGIELPMACNGRVLVEAMGGY
jgi:predicted AlkP superfamily pyrophosphatase or phosphodiesterase